MLIGVMVFVAAVVLLLVFWRGNFLAPPKIDSNLKIAFMDIGQGDATLIRFPNGEKMLVDCGQDATILAALGRNLRWNDRVIDYLVASHPDADHYGGCVDVLTRYQVRHIYFNGFEKESSQLLQQFHATVAAEIQTDGADFTLVSTTQKLVIASTTVQFLYPDHDITRDPHVPGVKKIDSNNTSIVLKISYGDSDVLVTGDMEIPLENYLVNTRAALLASEILKVGHHGSRSSSGETFLEAVAPQHAVISSGKNNRYGHPHRNVLYRMQRLGVKIWRTDEKSDILATLTTSTVTVNYASP